MVVFGALWVFCMSSSSGTGIGDRALNTCKVTREELSEISAVEQEIPQGFQRREEGHTYGIEITKISQAWDQQEQTLNSLPSCSQGPFPAHLPM